MARPSSSMADRDPQGFLRRMQDLVRDAEMVEDDAVDAMRARTTSATMSSQPVWPATFASPSSSVPASSAHAQMGMLMDQPPPLRPVSPVRGGGGMMGRTYG